MRRAKSRDHAKQRPASDRGPFRFSRFRDRDGGVPQPDAPRAARLDGYLAARHAALGMTPDPNDREERERIANALEGALPAEELAFLRSRGAALSEDDAIALAREV